MFEDSLFSSRRQTSSPRKRWTAAASVAIQLILTATLLLAPMLRPEMLPILSVPPALVVLPKPVRPPVVKPRELSQTTSASSAIRVPSVARVETVRGFLLSHSPNSMAFDGPTLLATGNGMGSSLPTGLGTLPSGDSTGTRVTVAPVKPQAKPRISAGISAGLLLQPIRPIYPPIAKTAHIQGIVVLTATIDKTGHIVGLQVVSGPAMLRSSAVDAVKEARYRPFLLNGEPTEVETTISVNFRMDQ